MVKDLQKNNLFGLFDCYLGSGKTKGWTKDMIKIKSIKNNIDFVNDLLDKNNVVVHRFLINDDGNFDVKNNFDIRKYITSWINKEKKQ